MMSCFRMVLLWILQLLLTVPLSAHCTNNTLLTEVNEISTSDLIYTKWANIHGSSSMVMGDNNNYTDFITINTSESATYGSIVWPLNGNFSAFTAVIGLSGSPQYSQHTNCIDKYGSDADHDGILYKFYIDDMLRHTSSQLLYASDFENININTTNGKSLKVEIYKLNSALCDNAVIANPILQCASNANILSTMFVTQIYISTTLQLNSTAKSSQSAAAVNANTVILISIFAVLFTFFTIWICVLLSRSKQQNKYKSHAENINIGNTPTPITKGIGNEMQPLGQNKHKANKAKFIHVECASDTTDFEINSNDINKDGELEDAGNSEIDLHNAENAILVMDMKHSVKETITTLDVGSLPNFDDEFEDENDGEDKLHFVMDTLANIDTEFLPNFDEEEEEEYED